MGNKLNCKACFVLCDITICLHPLCVCPSDTASQKYEQLGQGLLSFLFAKPGDLGLDIQKSLGDLLEIELTLNWKIIPDPNESDSYSSAASDLCHAMTSKTGLKSHSIFWQTSWLTHTRVSPGPSTWRQLPQNPPVL